MTPKDFEEVFDKQIAQCSAILISRSKTYSTVLDRLHNFKKAAHLQECSSEQALFGMVSKHIVALSDAIALEEPVSEGAWNEWITDIMNYMILLKAVLIEQNKA